MRKRSKLFHSMLTIAVLVAFVFTSFTGVFAEAETPNQEQPTEPKGYVTISVEKFALGLGYIVEPIRVPFFDGDTVDKLTVDVIGEENSDHEYNYRGDFWLYAVKDNETREPNWPQHILDNANIEYGREWDSPDWLGQYDYYCDSGWMYCVNGKFPDIVASGCTPKDGDVIRWQFTIVGLGRDIGANPAGSENADSWGADFIPIAQKDALTRLMGEINTLEDKDKLLEDKEIKAAYDNAKAKLEDIASSQEDVDSAFTQLENAMNKPEEPEEPAVPEEPATPIEAGTTLNWPQFLGNLELQGVSDAKTPRTGEEMEEKWRYSDTGGWAVTPGTPIIVGDYTYCYVNEKLIKINTKTGEVVKTAQCPGDAWFFINIAYGDGKIFVPRGTQTETGRKIYLIAYDADTLDQLFVTSSISDSGAQIQSCVFYNDGYIYCGPRIQNGKYAAFKTTDLDPSRPDEVVEPVWTIVTDTNLGIGTNAGPAFVNGACIFPDQGSRTNGSVIRSVNAKTGDLIDSITLPVNEVVTSTIVYYPKNNRIYIAASNKSGGGAVVRSYEINSDGSFNKDSMKAYISDVQYGGTQASPVIYNDRLYLGGGGGVMGSNEPFHVIDANTMEEIYRIDEILTKGTPILTTAYATKENNQEVYLYIVPYAPDRESNSSVMYIVRDSIGQTEPRYEKVTNVGDWQFSTQSMAISPDGNMVFYNDAKILYCYGNRNDTRIGALDIINQIDRLPDPASSPYYSGFEIRRIVERYQALSAEEKASVTNFSKLEEILQNVDPAEYLINGINSIPELEKITLDDQGKILSLKAAYDRLSDEEKAKVSNSEKLFKAIAKIEELQNSAAAEGVIKAIDKIRPLDKITSQDEASISAARARYNELSDDSKKLVSNFSKLEAAEKRLNEILDQIQKADKLIKDTLVGVPITANSKQLIDNVDKAVAGLAPEDLATISSYEQYFIPAKIDYINALISEKLMDGDKKVSVNKDNVDEIKGIIDEVQAHYKSIPESERKYIENYKVIAELQKDIAKLDNTQDNNTQDNNAKDNKLPRTGSVDYLPIGVIITIMGIALLAYRGRRQVKRY
ncbi:DUF4430 domain-containing protein [Syntrophaceticus schinkii]|jgi:hypothetical protein|uniref:Transcobalamin-like C-terminal domain-containing protein n=1 Tax=Syntrophaceticus schinkii TaxID=499207 RepID=A0A0B7MCS2_9FIRM|nr:DUF4430 domain-containing protein [Syntrophaceticus schinkii]CEO87870.1 conserved exported hypothetical protein [Syntrophaceticus schinkii]